MNTIKWLTCSILVIASSLVLASNEDLNSTSVTLVDEHTVDGGVNYFNGIETGDADGNINAVIEIPKGSTGKWEVDAKSGHIVREFKKGKPRAVTYQGGYPGNYGSVPKTAMPKQYGGDGETLDIIVIGDAIPRGTIVKVKIIGILNLLEDGDEYDGKLLAVALGSPESSVNSFAELNAKFNNVGTEISDWFSNYKGPGEIKLQGVGTVAEAMEVVTASAEAFTE